MHRFRLLYVAPLLAMLGLATLPLVMGTGTLYHRDVMGGHVSLKTAQAHLLAEGRLLPLVDPFRGGGQPMLGNPNALPIYPTNLLFLGADPLWAINAHFWLHWLLAPFSFFWFARTCGLGRPSAWAAATVYATSGYFLSQLNLYNLVTIAALAPAFSAALLRATGQRAAGPRAAGPRAKPVERRRAWRPWAVVGLLWALLIAGGDPMTTILTLGLGVTAAAFLRPAQGPDARQSWRVDLRSTWLPAFVALGLGTLVTLPMLVEFLRILPRSYRGFWESSMLSVLAQSWDPRTALEWFLPLVFGNIDYSFWGRRFFGGNPPFFYSLYPGVLALVLVLCSGLGRTRLRIWAWAWIALGLFLALGFYNPIMRAAYELPGLSNLRYPIKFWILVAIPASLLAGVGFGRWLDGHRAPVRALGWASLAYLLIWLALLRLPTPVAELLRSFAPELRGAAFATEHLRWTTSVFFVLLASVACWWLARRGQRATDSAAAPPSTEPRTPTESRRPRPSSVGLGAGLLVIHAASQLFLLQPLYDTDASAPHTASPAPLEVVPPGSRVVDGGLDGLFGKAVLEPGYPDLRFVWLLRERAGSLGRALGVRHGLRYVFDHSPEGLDSFYSISLEQAMERGSDRDRVRILASAAVDRLLVHRPLEPEALDEVRLLGTYDTGEKTLHVYQPTPAIEPFRLVGNLVHRDSMNGAFATLIGDGFDPRTTAVLPSRGGEPDRAGPAGTVAVILDDAEESILDVRSAEGGALVTPRSWLAIYRAEIDGEPVDVEVVNIHALGVRVPAGEHRVRIWADRRPTRASAVVAGLALAALLALGWWPVARKEPTPRDPGPA